MFQRPKFQKPKRETTSEEESFETNQKVSNAAIKSTQGASSSVALNTLDPVETNSALKRLQKVDAVNLNELNKLQSKVLKAKLLGSAEYESLQAQYNLEKRKHDLIVDIDKITTTKPLSTATALKKETKQETKKDMLKTHDFQGNRLHYQQIDNEASLDDLIRHEKQASNKRYDDTMASHMIKHSKSSRGLDDIDDALDAAPSHKKKSKHQKQQHYGNKDEQKLSEALEKCLFCYTPERVPKVSVVALGTRTYLGLIDTIDLVPGHCFIAPTTHVQNTLECDDDVWDEIRNFMKCLIRMFAKQNKGVVFMEQAIHFHKKRHAIIECIPLPAESFDDAPAFFKEAILESAEEWSTHKKLIDTKKGIRKTMVKNLPYFHVWFDPNGGMGHIIEDEKAWPSWFGKEIIAGMMDIDPSRWRRPQKIEYSAIAPRLQRFKAMYNPFDWTKALD